MEIKNLTKYFKVRNNVIKAVDNINLTVRKGETLSIVGESGSGKTTLARTLINLYTPTSGFIKFNGSEITQNDWKNKNLKRKIQYIFQDPYASLNPRLTVSEIIGEPLDIHSLYSNKDERTKKISKLLSTVGLNSEHGNRYPHEFSGGQRQRIGIARALAVEPEVIICDEPVSALDVSIRSQILNMLEDLQKQFNLTYVFISHDLGVVRHISDRVAVMYLGNIIELGDVENIYNYPLHPYTKALISSIPEADINSIMDENRIVLKGEIPSPMNPPSGCKFRTRCPIANSICTLKEPIYSEIKENHFVSCHFAK